MMKKTLILFSTACLLILTFVLTGCEKKDYYQPVPGSDEPSLFDYSTSQDVQLNITYTDIPDGLISVFDVYMENPLLKGADGKYVLKSGLTPVAGGIMTGNRLSINKTLPAAAKVLFVYSPDLFVPQLMVAQIEAGVANFAVVDLSTPSVESSTRTLGGKKIDGYLRKGAGNATTVGATMDINTSTYKPNYIVGKKKVEDKYLNRIKSAFPNGVAVTNREYYRDAIMYLYEDAEIKLSLIHADADHYSSLSYFFYTGTPEQIQTIDKNKVREVVAVPCARLDMAMGLKSGDMIELMYYDEVSQTYVNKFPKNTTIGFMLRSNAFVKPASSNSYTPSINTSKDVFYSCLPWNSDNFQHTIYFNAATINESEPFVCLGFEDIKGGGDKDCNDIMFHVDINPGTAIVEPPHVPEVGYVTYTENRKGILAFEDNWPSKGDYDLNDVVVSYTSKTTYLQKTEGGVPQGGATIASLEDKFTLVHSGANYKNAFAYKMDVPASAIDKVTIDSNPYTPVVDGSGLIVKISDNVYDDLGTVKTGPEYTCTPKTLNVKVNFKIENGITQKIFNDDKLFAPYNPYIVADNKAGYEVHLPKYPPTSKADPDLFGTADDRSEPGSGLYYAGPANTPYPFAIHILGVDGYAKMPVETKSIDYTYPKYTNWVNSKFTEDLEWYNSPADVN